MIPWNHLNSRAQVKLNFKGSFRHNFVYLIPSKGSMTLGLLLNNTRRMLIRKWEVPTRSMNIEPQRNLKIVQYLFEKVLFYHQINVKVPRKSKVNFFFLEPKYTEFTFRKFNVRDLLGERDSCCSASSLLNTASWRSLA